MARRTRGSGDARHRSPAADGPAVGSPRWVDHLGLYETGNGLPHGPMAIWLAVAIAAVVDPVARLARYLARR